jgi:hypothetical protein
MDVALLNMYNNETVFNEIFPCNKHCFLQENGVHIMQKIIKVMLHSVYHATEIYFKNRKRKHSKYSLHKKTWGKFIPRLN